MMNEYYTPSSKPVVIVIAGYVGSGKSTAAILIGIKDNKTMTRCRFRCLVECTC
jgi:pantothenate kinase-related protein Tda10